MATPMTTPIERLSTTRLLLDPLRPDHADEMVEVLVDPRLYAFTGGTPPDREALRARYERQVIGHSVDGSETWRNWIIRWRASDAPVGFVQATITDETRSADIAWLVGVSWQGQGIAVEAATAMVGWLERTGVGAITAHVHPDHAASAAVASRLGLVPTDEMHDGERVWRRALATKGPNPG